MTRIRPLTAVMVLALLGGCSGGPPPADEPAPIPVATTVTGAQILTTGHEYTRCLRDNGIAAFPEPVVEAGRLAWPDRTTARSALDALEHNTPAVTACAPILDPVPPSRLWPGWTPPRERTSWNTGSKDDPTVDDAAYIDGLLDHLLATLCIDPPGADGATQTINATTLVWRFFRTQRLG